MNHLMEKGNHLGGLFKRTIRRIARTHYLLERMIYYRNPRGYWSSRGGETYFQEQESYSSRQIRSEWITTEIAQVPARSILEIGCGYGKQLKNLKNKTAAKLFGVDFSHPQLCKAREFIPFSLPLIEANAAALPFANDSFDLVFSSAVILHNPPQQAKLILSEMIRTSRGYLVHNEDKNVSSTRYGYDLVSFYEQLEFEIIASGPVHGAKEPEKTQFLIVHFNHSKKQNLSQKSILSALL